MLYLCTLITIIWVRPALCYRCIFHIVDPSNPLVAWKNDFSVIVLFSFKFVIVIRTLASYPVETGVEASDLN